MKNILFDLGGVLLDIDPSKTRHAFQELGLEESVANDGWKYQHDVFLRMEKGELSDQQFRDGIRELLPNDPNDQEIDDAWCAMLLNFPAEKIELLKNLSKSYRLFLFSNTNQIHLDWFREMFFEKFQFPLDDLFEKAFYSHIVGKRKPDVQSYRVVLELAGINASETLFVDDLEKNIIAAKQVGLQTNWLKPGDDLISVFL